jgi:hypothetical protein
MASANAVIYRKEFVDSFHQQKSKLMGRCISESMSMGLQAVFDIADLGGELPERGTDGNLARLHSNDEAVTVTLKEHGGSFTVTDFEDFIKAPDQREKMHRKIVARAERTMDLQFIEALDGATNQYNGGTAVTLTPDILGDAIATLEENDVPINPDDVTLLITPQGRRQLMKSAEYTSKDYVPVQRYDHHPDRDPDERQITSFLDVGIINSSRLKGVGTSTAKCYLFHRRAMGCAEPDGQKNFTAGFDEREHLHFASGTIRTGFKLLQQRGVLQIIHDDRPS